MAKSHVLILGMRWWAQPFRLLSTLSAFALVGSALLWVYLILLPAPVIVDTVQSGGSVYFAANRSVILSPGDCVTLRWQVDQIRNVYLNGLAQIGSGESRMCISGEMPTLTVQFQDDSQHTYELGVRVLSTSPLTGAIIGLALVVAIFHFTQLKQILVHPKHLALLLGLSVLIVALFFGQMIPLSETIATSKWLEASAATKDLLIAATLMAGLIVMTIAIVRVTFLSNDTAATRLPSWHRLVAWWGIGFILTFAVIAATIIAINPLGMYFTSSYPSYQLLLRGSKTDGYRQQPQTPDLVIMGSSRAFTLSPTYIEQKTGYIAYNMAIEGGRIEDLLIQARQMPTFPKIMLIEIQDGLPRQPNDIAARAPLTWIPYMQLSTALLTLQKRLEGLVDVNQLAQALYTARYSVLYQRQPKEWPAFEKDGFASRPLISASELDQAILLDIGNIPAIRCARVDETSKSDVQALIQMAQAHQTSLVFYMSPWQPQYYDTLLKDDPKYQQCHDASIAFMNNLAQSYNHVFFLDYSRLDSIGGMADETGFYDSQHLTEANSQRLIDHALDTLRLAYQTATQD